MNALKYRGGFHKAQWPPPVGDKYVPSEKQRAEDGRLKERLDHLTGTDLRKFDKLLKKAFKP